MSDRDELDMHTGAASDAIRSGIPGTVDADARRRRAGEVWLGCLSNDLTRIDEHFAPNYELHVPDRDEPIQGRDGLRDYIEDLRSSFPDIVFTPEDVIVEGDRVATRCRVTGTHLGPFEGMPPTGRPFAVDAITFSRYEGDLVREDHHVLSRGKILDQLGLIPEAGVGGLIRFGATLQRLKKGAVERRDPVVERPSATQNHATLRSASRHDEERQTWTAARPRRVVAEIIDGGSYELLPELLREDFALHVVARPEPVRGRHELVEFIDQLHAAFPDISSNVEQMISEGNRVAIRYRLKASHVGGSYMGLHPSGRSFETLEHQVSHVDDAGRGTESWQALDAVHVLRQLDHMPAPGLGPLGSARFLARSIARSVRGALRRNR